MNTSNGVISHNEDHDSHCIDTTPDALPKVLSTIQDKNSNTGVSTISVAPEIVPARQERQSWYALRTTYGREKKAYDYIVEHGGIAFYPTIITERIIKGKKTKVEVSRIPNLFFAYGDENSIQRFVYDNVNLPYLRFYYRHIHDGFQIKKEPLLIPDNQIESLRIICKAEADDILLLSEEIMKFKIGQKVRVVQGDFAGVEGTVARFQGQQRVGIVIDGLLTIATAYIPNAFLEKIEC